jgi:serine/threonine-protein kinase
MLLKRGGRLGPYEILDAIGAGGMGEVFRAHDSRLQRDVAIKVLPDTVASDPERRARFEREARLLAVLNDPRIAAIYGVEEDPATHALALVMELVEGPTLEERLASGPLLIDEALDAARQIAEALEAAHERGVIHRDLKPANVKVTAGGDVKVLDFGLAKALGGEAASGDDTSTSPTITNHATLPGVILGTAAYMAPEQARGRPVDRRGDIWAFGAILFEMLTGERAFSGQTVSDTIAAILTSAPDWTRLPAATPPVVRHLLRRCLDRDPHTRLQSVGEARVTLSDPGITAHPEPALRAHGRPSWLLYGVLAVAAAVGGVALGWILKPTQSAGRGVLKLDLAVDDLELGADRPPALSPDGQRIVYRASERLFVRALNGSQGRELAGTGGAFYFFWSPDSRQVAFVSDGRAWRTSVDSGKPLPLGRVPKDFAGSAQGVWTSDDQLVLVGSDSAGLFAVPAGGGEGKEILALDKAQETDFHQIAQLPDGRGLIFTVHRLAHGPDTIAVFAGGKRRTVLQIPGEGLRSPVYSAPGYVMFHRDAASSGLWAIKFSLNTLTTEGVPFMVAPGGSYPTIGSDGTVAYIYSSDLPPELVWRSRDGSVERIGSLPAEVPRIAELQTFRLSPDERRVAICLGTGDSDVWNYDLDRRTVTKLSTNTWTAHGPIWTPSGSHVFFSGFGRERVWNVHKIGARETGEPHRVTNSAVFTWPADISPDGRWLMYAEGRPPKGTLQVMPLERPDASRSLATPPVTAAQARFSPDGQWIAYSTFEGARQEVYLRRFPADQERIPVSTTGGSYPVWARNGRTLFFRSGDRLQAVGVKPTATGLELTTPAPAIVSSLEPEFHETFDVASDGRFLMVRSVGRDRIGIILNWTSELPTLEGAK